jgi:thiol:disulfide interchange protein DsbC
MVKKIFMLMLGCVLVIAPFSAHAFPAKKGDKNCMSCHKLDRKDAEAIVKKIGPNVTVTDVKQSPIKGVWQLEVDAGAGKHGVVYLDFAKKFVMPQIIPVESLGKQAPPRKVDVSKIPLGDAIVLGSPTAKKKVVVFTDPDCPYCRELHKVMKQIIAKRDDVSFALMLIPLPMHQDSPKKIEAILCSRSLAMLDDAFAGKTVPAPAATCTGDATERNKALAKTLQFDGTPTLVRDDGLVHSGVLPEEKLLDWIDKKQ